MRLFNERTLTDPTTDIPDWVYSQAFDEIEAEQDERAAFNVKQAFNLRDRCTNDPTDEGDDGAELVEEITRLLARSGELGLVSRAILRPLAVALDPAQRMMKAARQKADKLEAERLGVNLQNINKTPPQGN